MSTDNFHIELFERIDKIAKHYNISKRQISFLLNVSTSFFVKPRDISASKVIALKKSFPNLSYDYILEGKGDIVDCQNQEVDEKRWFEKVFVDGLMQINDIQSKQIEILLNADKKKSNEDYIENLYMTIDILKRQFIGKTDSNTIDQMLEVIKVQNEQLKEAKNRLSELEEQLRKK